VDALGKATEQQFRKLKASKKLVAGSADQLRKMLE